ncbi:MAG: FAD:protein FMN transferase [Balneolales bacterium]
MSYAIAFYLSLLLMPPVTEGQDLQRYEFDSPQMGTLFRIVFYARNDSLAEAASEAAFNRVQALNAIMSDYEHESELNALSRTSGSGAWEPVSPPLFFVLNRSMDISCHTDGAFDITVRPFVQLWRDATRKANPVLPHPDTLAKAAKSVGFRHMDLDAQRGAVRLNRRGMQLDLGGIAKGYAADQILDELQQFGITSALADAGGDILAGDPPPGQKGWNVVVPARDAGGATAYRELTLSNAAITSSGDLYQSVTIGGKKYSHIIDPGTGLGLTENITVTVIAPDAVTADGYASALSVMGPEKAARLVEGFAEMEVFIEFERSGSFEQLESTGFGEFIQARE